jgi:hypothetical protein
MSGRSGWGGWPPQPIPGTAQPGALPTKGGDDPARDTIDTAETARGGTGDKTWHPPTPPPTAPEAGRPAH